MKIALSLPVTARFAFTQKRDFPVNHRVLLARDSESSKSKLSGRRAGRNQETKKAIDIINRFTIWTTANHHAYFTVMWTNPSNLAPKPSVFRAG
jgi:hypothetical protein